MKNSLVFLLLLTAIACDAPQRGRAPVFGRDANSLGNTGTFGQPSGTPGATTPGTTTPGTISNSPGFSTCNLSSFNTSAPILGGVAVCQSSLDESMVKFRPNYTDVTQTCLIPTYKLPDNSSTPLGDPQCTATEAGKEYNGKLYKNRNGSHPINGITIMKLPLVQEYFNCMNAYQQYFNHHNCQFRYTQAEFLACQNAARQYQAGLCSTFKQKYAGQYLDLRLAP